MSERMNFNDLRANDIVLLENGKRLMVYLLDGKRILINKNSYIDGNLYNSIGLVSEVNGFDIVEVRRPIYPLHLMEEKWDWARVIWRRE